MFAGKGATGFAVSLGDGTDSIWVALKPAEGSNESSMGYVTEDWVLKVPCPRVVASDRPTGRSLLSDGTYCIMVPLFDGTQLNYHTPITSLLL